MLYNIDNIYYKFYLFAIFATYGKIYVYLPLPGIYYLITYGITTVLCLFIFIGNKSWMEWNYPQMKISWVIFLWAVILLFMTPYNFYLTLRSSMAFFLLFPIIIATIHVLDSPKKLMNMTLIIAIATSIFSIKAILSYDGIYFPGLQNMWNPNIVSQIFSFTLPFSAIMITQEKEKIKRIVYAFTIIASLFMIILAKSRTGFGAVVIFGLLYWVWSPKKILIGTIMSIILLIGIIITGNEYVNEMSSIASSDTRDIDSRFAMWEYSFNEIFMKNPLGIGINNTTRYLNSISGLSGGGNHSMYVTFLTDLGIIGLLLFIYLSWINLKTSFKIMKNSTSSITSAFAFACFCFMVIFMLTGTMEVTSYDPAFWIATAFIAATSKIHQHESIRSTKNEDIIRNTSLQRV